MKSLLRSLSLLCFCLSAILVYRYIDRVERRMREVVVSDWQHLPKGPAGTLVRDRKSTAKLWFDGRNWSVVAGNCSEILETRLKVIPGPARGDGRTEPLVTVGLAPTADLIGLVRRGDGQVQIGAEIWGLEYSMGKAFRPAGSSYYLDLVVDAINGTIRVSYEDAVVFETRTKPWAPSSRVIGTNPFGGSFFSGRFSGAVVEVPSPRTQQYAEARLDGPVKPAYPAGSVYFLIKFSTGRFGRGEPLLVTGATGRADLFSVTVDDPGHLHFTFDHWGGAGAVSPSVPFDSNVPHLIVIRRGSLPGFARVQAVRGNTYSVALDGKDVLMGEASFYPAGPGELFVAANPVGGSSCDPSPFDEILEKGISL